MESRVKASSVRDYIAQFPDDVRVKLESLRQIIRESAPGAEEVISYSMPAYKQEGVLVYFAAYANHIGFYPTSSGIEAFKNELSGYKWSKGAVQFALEKPLPRKLITRMVKFKLNENTKRISLKKSKK